MVLELFEALHTGIQSSSVTRLHQFIGATNQTNGFKLVEPIDGILGLGPAGSNYGDISGFNATPTFVETLFNQSQIPQMMFGIYIAPLGVDGTSTGAGEITFGGIDRSKIQEELEI